MTDWTAGYIADFGYYQESNPIRVRLAFLNADLVSPEQGTHCELGFGQGVSANIHAAAAPLGWFATDFNPSQAGWAAMGVSGSGIVSRFNNFSHKYLPILKVLQIANI